MVNNGRGFTAGSTEGIGAKEMLSSVYPTPVITALGCGFCRPGT